jgi:Tfp pilus assembly protein PilF
MVDEAMAQFMNCIERDPKHADAYYNLGVGYVLKDDSEKAKEMIEKALEIQPNHELANTVKKLLDLNN